MSKQVNLDAMTFDEFKNYMHEKLEEFEKYSRKSEDMVEFMEGNATVPLGDWFEWFGCQSNLM